MSELQIGLLIVGAAVIVGVIAYNRIQEARFRRRAEQAFAPDRGDALLESAHSAGARIEPQLPPGSDGGDLSSAGRQEPRAVAMPPSQTPSGPVMPSPARADTDSICYVAEIRAERPVMSAALESLLSDLGALARRVRLEGQSQAEGWVALDARRAGAFHRVRLSLQLVDRSGAVSGSDLATFQSAVARCAASLSASAEIPESAPFVERARGLDAFCAEVDVVVGINILAAHGKPFPGTRLRGLAEAAGLRLAEPGAFVFPDAGGAPRFTMENQDATPFTGESLRGLSTSGVTLLLEVPRVADGMSAFDQMVSTGRSLATSLGGTLVDDNRVPVTAQGLEQIRSQLRSIYATMEAQGIPAGSPAALRLFA